MSRARGWQRLSLRARLMVIGVLGVAVALALGSLALYGVLTLVSFRSLDNTGRRDGEPGRRPGEPEPAT